MPSRKTTPAAKARPARSLAGRRLDAMPDRVDIRDWFYRPSLLALPDTMVNCARVPAVLDQGTEGACTGFALSAVINYLIAQRAGTARDARLPVSPRMLYEMARRYDEWPGEAYEGSSARGAMKGWVRHGVCHRTLWPDDRHGSTHLTPDIVARARQVPGGAFYRVAHREIRDMHAALAELGILYVTLMVHDGWDEPGPTTRTLRFDAGGRAGSLKLPVIMRKGRAASGHAVAICGFTEDGFVVQNSWGKGWGRGGFALLPYEDFLLHATDVWAAQLGVPVALDLWAAGAADTTQGMARAEAAIPLDQVRPFIVDVGNNGELSRKGDYWTTESDVTRLFREVIPARAKAWPKRRVLLYLHGGLNSEAATARRVVAFRDVLLENEIYPLHIMWESGAFETLRHIVDDVFTAADERAGAIGDWMRKLRDGLREGRDMSLELTAAAIGGTLWREMKENARLASDHPAGKGAAQVMARELAAALGDVSAAERARWEVHVVAHSAGAIFAAHALPHLLGAGLKLASLHLMAPAMTLDLFRATLMPAIKRGECPLPDTYILGDQAEQDDTVGPYGKSLLFLVSNAFEARRATPLLGMQRHIEADAAVRKLLAPGLVVARTPRPGAHGESASRAHGGFDNDPATMNSILRNILGRAPTRPFDTRDMVF
ncbi:C1 family peptidase [Falsiroseomonas oryzae]|uniref:C1 family peptidase n=1 Tax=Falsiroseomonas oryzae TaxID=2766473 RepID=UPI0022EA808B|nr:C1 family peptidase [Roseomonas sp. MO-31]